MVHRNLSCRLFTALALATALAGSSLSALAQSKPVELLNVSYDPTRELYVEFNAAFAKYWKAIGPVSALRRVGLHIREGEGLCFVGR